MVLKRTQVGCRAPMPVPAGRGSRLLVCWSAYIVVVVLLQFSMDIACLTRVAQVQVARRVQRGRPD
jgi:hypothetical protein